MRIKCEHVWDSAASSICCVVSREQRGGMPILEIVLVSTTSPGFALCLGQCRGLLSSPYC